MCNSISAWRTRLLSLSLVICTIFIAASSGCSFQHAKIISIDTAQDGYSFIRTFESSRHSIRRFSLTTGEEEVLFQSSNKLGTYINTPLSEGFAAWTMLGETLGNHSEFIFEDGDIREFKLDVGVDVVGSLPELRQLVLLLVDEQEDTYLTLLSLPTHLPHLLVPSQSDMIPIEIPGYSVTSRAITNADRHFFLIATGGTAQDNGFTLHLIQVNPLELIHSLPFPGARASKIRIVSDTQVFVIASDRLDPENPWRKFTIDLKDNSGKMQLSATSTDKVQDDNKAISFADFNRNVHAWSSGRRVNILSRLTGDTIVLEDKVYRNSNFQIVLDDDDLLYMHSRPMELILYDVSSWPPTKIRHVNLRELEEEFKGDIRDRQEPSSRAGGGGE